MNCCICGKHSSPYGGVYDRRNKKFICCACEAALYNFNEYGEREVPEHHRRFAYVDGDMKER